jgi:hypothetical protein
MRPKIEFIIISLFALSVIGYFGKGYLGEQKEKNTLNIAIELCQQNNFDESIEIFNSLLISLK